ncbi:Phosphoribosylamine--glycine ligase [Methanosarcina lacustris Z-7289]|uniref:Phosphoribosylamine--glycine ligase n=1 Tax=Methanosarcina lacustris Z-7289 TaxID=1434111 RepID=A0A0E3S7X3_9EURY|nr:phosphoribosylamine--glycine ligase [Methanosarcina lacustris]AKB75158.1 Phosphoribosylamine--glycine ligase [Methanosarcina lacustris Z-7289]
MKILLIGGGGREHAIAEGIKKSKHNPILYALMAKKNPGIAALCEDFLLEKETEVAKIVEYAKARNIEMAFVGPEAPLAAGVADALWEAGVPVVGPRKACAVIEFDKAWARNFMKKYDIEGCPAYEVFTDEAPAHAFIEKLGDVAVKPSGLTGGKGVKVMGDQLPDLKAAREYTSELLEKGSVVIEERFIGEEFTLQAFVDGKNLAFFPAVQDHKRAYEGDLGPNTGGMGSYTDAGEILPFMLSEDLEQAKKIMQHTVTALYEETGTGYQGILYGQFILTASGPKVVEFNARFGDPEAMNVIPLIETDFIEIMSAVVKGTLQNLPVKFSRKATVCKYAVPEGYPDNPVKDSEVLVGDIGEASVYYASVYEKEGKIYTTGSRAVAVVGCAETIEAAEKIAQNALENIRGKLFFRKDIGTANLIQKRIDHMKELRG